MYVTIDRQSYSVTIENDELNPYIHLSLAADDALKLLRSLSAKENEIYDLAAHYYECHCGQVHPISVKECPHLAERDDDDE